MIDEISQESSDPWYRKMLLRVTEETKYPQWRRCEERLYEYIKTSSGLGYEKDNWKKFIPKERRNHIIREAYDSPNFGHMGVLKTVGRISEKFYWPKLRNDVVRYLRKCQICAAHNIDQKGPRGYMTPEPRPTRP